MQKNLTNAGYGTINQRTGEQHSGNANVKAVHDIIQGTANILADQFDSTIYNRKNRIIMNKYTTTG
jgi:hypothetical protein